MLSRSLSRRCYEGTLWSPISLQELDQPVISLPFWFWVSLSALSGLIMSASIVLFYPWKSGKSDLMFPLFYEQCSCLLVSKMDINDHVKLVKSSVYWSQCLSSWLLIVENHSIDSMIMISFYLSLSASWPVYSCTAFTWLPAAHRVLMWRLRNVLLKWLCSSHFMSL